MRRITKADIDIIGQAATTLDDLVGSADQYFAERSKTWQESDKGTAYEEWLYALAIALAHCNWLKRNRQPSS
jgi:hypothetical protein